MNNTLKEKEDFERLPITLPAPLIAQVKEISANTGIPVSAIVRQALEGKLADYKEVAERIRKIKGT